MNDYLNFYTRCKEYTEFVEENMEFIINLERANESDSFEDFMKILLQDPNYTNIEKESRTINELEKKVSKVANPIVQEVAMILYTMYDGDNDDEL